METYKDHITITPDLNDERLQTLRKLYPDWFTQEGMLDINEVKKATGAEDASDTERYEFDGSASQQPSVMLSHLRELPCTTTPLAASMPTRLKTLSLRVRTSKCSRYSSRGIVRKLSVSILTHHIMQMHLLLTMMISRKAKKILGRNWHNRERNRN